ncbi:hypothetical protein [Sulfuriroseicoccus oceanibius]|uniref:Uncharacterized protein n=1 Tax=Sulfuriroseicoccus oceanibius TaxID=2707525 RepID=A0A6B3LEG0_9BACT|nr:hypothetical protein [Sulfuriroseicoccus oceanibius]QQL44063.1 hypothetical protein G3M56_009170 [Sulfuriroseicoccus oceanibius]
MDFDTIRPILSGLIGATIAGWLAIKLAKQLPHAENQTKQRKLAKDHRHVILAANIGAGIALATGLIIYLGGILDDRDLRGLGLTMGLMAFLPSLVIVIGNFRGGTQQISDGFMAYSLAQKTPPFLLFALMFLMFCGGLWATYAFIPKQEAEQGVGGNPLPRLELQIEP